MSNNKLYLKGFANFGFFNVDQDTEDAYSVSEGDRKKVPSARTCSPTDNRTDFKINADDGVWDEGSDWTDTTMEVAFAQMELATLAAMTGAKVNEDGSIDEGALDTSPDLALTFSALRADGGYRLYRFYNAKVTNISVSHTTKGESTDAQVYTLTFKCIPRKCDQKIRTTLDIDKGDTLDWLESIPSTPTTQATPTTPPSDENEGA